MKLKKTVALLLSAVLSVGIFTGCSNSSDSKESGKELVYEIGRASCRERV